MPLIYPAPASLKNPTVAVGNFDGVHAGHRALLQAARALGGPLVVLTFEPHPRAILNPGKPFERLMTPDEKVAALQPLADAVAVLPFDRDVAGWTPEEFVNRALVEWLGAAQVVVGENFRFGHKAAGTTATLAACPAFATTVVPLLADAGGMVISSSRLRAKND
ncbi:MAG TPA: FAD synthetase family protein [Alphaproteobacteria bacterium]|nr:FAD synthetase family protein [Alphaproteobacteria bacterium]